ncbi:iron ABC transporter permease [Nitriliruptoraceae bacterium ZYF776]|nr:iron ABC transporter permease [Profundirhabdus halotolerans]
MLVRSPIEQVAPAVLWLTGTLHGRTWQHVTWAAIGLGVLLPLALALAPQLRVLALGDDAARALGLRADRSRTLLLVVSASSAAVAVAVAGPVGFVALVVPHVARLLLGPTTGGVLVVATLLGSLLVVVSDLLAQHAFPVSLPVGVVTALVGAPYFLFLLHRSNRGTA